MGYRVIKLITKSPRPSKYSSASARNSIHDQNTIIFVHAHICNGLISGMWVKALLLAESVAPATRCEMSQRAGPFPQRNVKPDRLVLAPPQKMDALK